MSCCTIKEDIKTSKHLIDLRKEFDEVLIEKKEEYQLVTLRDRANKNNYDWIVWLQFKVEYQHTNS